MHQCPRRAPKTPTLLDVLGLRGRLKESKSRNARSSASAGQKLQVAASPTRIVGGGTCQSEIKQSLKKAVWRLWLVSKSRTKSSAEGCE
jgi:hypothetical protein